MFSLFASYSRNKDLVFTYLVRSYPIIGNTLNMLVLDAIHMMMISRIGMQHTAAAVLVHTLLNIFKRINSGMAVSASILIVRADGQKNYKRVAQLFTHALLVHMAFACTCFILLILLSSCISYASPSAEVAILSHSYLQIIAISFIPFVINNIIRRYLESISYGAVALGLGLFTLVTSVLLSFLLICGKFEFPMLGLNGAGVALVIAETLTAIIGLLYVVYRLKPRGYFNTLHLDQISWRYLRKIWWVGWPVGLQFGIESLYLFGIAVIVGWISMEAQAAHAILGNISQLISIFSIGLGNTSSMLVAQQRSIQHGRLVRKIASMGCIMVTMASIVVGFCLLMGGNYMADAYKSVYVVKELVRELIKYLIVFQLFYGSCYMGNSVLRALNDRGFPFKLNSFIQFVSLLVCYILVIEYHWNIGGIWLILVFERILLSICLGLRFVYKLKA